MRKQKKILSASIFALAVGCLYLLFFYTPKFAWDPSAEREVIYTSVTRQHIDMNYIPSLRIWGNGAAVWAYIAPDGSRAVYQGHISRAQTAEILTELKGAGFFRLSRFLPRKEEYNCGVSAQDDTFYVVLDQGVYSTFIWTSDERTCAIIRDLVRGEGLDGEAFVPTTGKLRALPVEKAGLPPTVEALYQWPDAAFGYDLESVYTAQQDREITGQELALAWEIVNSGHPVVSSNGKKFWIAVMIEGITQ